MRHRAALPSIAALASALAGCGPTIVRSDLMAIQETSLEAALQRLRPEWLRLNPSARQVGQPARASVYVDNVYAGDLDVLRLVPVSTVIDVRFLAPSAARDQFGAMCRCEAGVILVATRRVS
jgi:hypothetical protein